MLWKKIQKNVYRYLYFPDRNKIYVANYTIFKRVEINGVLCTFF